MMLTTQNPSSVLQAASRWRIQIPTEANNASVTRRNNLWVQMMFLTSKITGGWLWCNSQWLLSWKPPVQSKPRPNLKSPLLRPPLLLERLLRLRLKRLRRKVLAPLAKWTKLNNKRPRKRRNSRKRESRGRSKRLSRRRRLSVKNKRLSGESRKLLLSELLPRHKRMPSKRPWWRKKPEEWKLNPTDLLLLLKSREKESKESKKSDAKRRSEDFKLSRLREDAKSRLLLKERDKDWSSNNREELRSSVKESNKRRNFLSRSSRHKLSCQTVFSKWKLLFSNLPLLLRLKSFKLELCNIDMSNRWGCKLTELEHSRRLLLRRFKLLLLNTRHRRHN